MAQAKAEFDAELSEASALKVKRDANKILSDQMQADADAKADAEKAAYAKKIEDAQVVENSMGLDMKEMIDARKQLNNARVENLDKERFEYAKKIRDEAEENYQRVHAEFKSVAEQMEYARLRRLNWSKQSLKTTNDEVWTSNMPLYIQSETNADAKAVLEKEYRMAQEANKTTPAEGTEEEKKDAKEEKKEETKNETKEEAKEEKKSEKKEEKKMSPKEEEVADIAAGVNKANSAAAIAAAETDDQRYYADFKAEMQNKAQHREA